MANARHLAILNKSVGAWNEWRKQIRDEHPDLSAADLKGAYLCTANLSGARLNGTNLKGANLNRANLCDAALYGANLCMADLSMAYLDRANLNGASLNGANLRMASLSEAYLSCANLSEASLNRTNLRGAYLVGGHFDGTNLSAANLSGANIRGAHLRGANLAEARLVRANLEDADLTLAQLCRCNLAEAILTGGKLYATARDDWIIEGVECKYVFWDAKGEIRSPRDRDLAPGEFERLYRTLPTIEYIFQNGMTPMDPLIMDRVVEAIREQNPQYDIQIDSINARGLAPSIRLTVQQEEHKEPALVEVTRRYDSYIDRLEADKVRLGALLAQSLENNHLQTFLLSGAVERIGDNIHAEAGANVATRGASIHIEYISNIIDLQKAVAEQPEDSETFAKVAKKTALDIIGGALKDIAKGQVKKAAEQIIELGKDLGPVILNTAAYAFFRDCLGL